MCTYWGRGSTVTLWHCRIICVYKVLHFTTLSFLAYHQLPVESRPQHQSPPPRRHDTSLDNKQLPSHNEQCHFPAQAKKDDTFLGTDTRDLMVAGQTGTSGQEHCQNILFVGERSHGK